ncbi:unnamed protein product [Aphanomyces euteiches]
MSANGWEGWVHKQGSVVPSWKKRYLVLADRNITYYDRDTKDPKAKAKGSFYLAGVQTNKDINNGLTLHSGDGKAMNIYTKTIGEFVMCKNAMENAVAVKNERLVEARQDYRASSIPTSSVSETYSSRSADSRSPSVDHSMRSAASSDIARYGSKPSHYGWLEKEGDLVKSWKRRYFTLHGLDITYFDNVDGVQKGSGRITDVQPLDGGLHFHLDNNRVLKVKADTHDEIQGWYDAVNRALGRPIVEMRRYTEPEDYQKLFGGDSSTLASSNQYAGGGYNASSSIANSPQTRYGAENTTNQASPYYQPTYNVPSTIANSPPPRYRNGSDPNQNSPEIAPVSSSYNAPSSLGNSPPTRYRQDTSSNQNNPSSPYIQAVEEHDDDMYQGNPYIQPSVAESDDDMFQNNPYIQPVVAESDDDMFQGNPYIQPVVAESRESKQPAATPPQEKKLQSFLDKYMGDSIHESSFETGIPSMAEEAMASVTTTLVADFSNDFEMDELASPRTSELNAKGQGLWLQKGGATYFPDENAEPTVIPPRSPIAKDIPPPVIKAPVVRSTSSDEHKKKLWVPEAPAAVVETNLAVEPKKQRFGVALPGMAPATTGTTAAAVPESVVKAKEVRGDNKLNDFLAKYGNVDEQTEPQASPEPQPSAATSGLWIQKGSAVPTVMPTRSMIATDIPPPAAKQPIVRNTSSDDLKNKLWVASSNPVGTAKVPEETVKQPAPVNVSPPTSNKGSKLNDFMSKYGDHVEEKVPAVSPTTASGLWIQKGGATYVPDENAEPTVLPSRSPIATDIPPPVVKTPIVRTTSSDELKKKLWVAPSGIQAETPAAQASAAQQTVAQQAKTITTSNEVKSENKPVVAPSISSAEKSVAAKEVTNTSNLAKNAPTNAPRSIESSKPVTSNVPGQSTTVPAANPSNAPSSDVKTQPAAAAALNETTVQEVPATPPTTTAVETTAVPRREGEKPSPATAPRREGEKPSPVAAPRREGEKPAPVAAPKTDDVKNTTQTIVEKIVESQPTSVDVAASTATSQTMNVKEPVAPKAVEYEEHLLSPVPNDGVPKSPGVKSPVVKSPAKDKHRKTKHIEGASAPKGCCTIM